MSASPLMLLFPVALVYAAAMDVVTMTIPNRVSILLVAAFLIIAPFAGLSAETIGWHVAAGAAALVVGIALFSFNLMGGGDAKLISAVAVWVGFGYLLHFLVMMALVGGALAIAMLAFRRIVPAGLAGKASWSERLHAPGAGIPYGVAIAGGGLWVYPKTAVFLGLVG